MSFRVVLYAEGNRETTSAVLPNNFFYELPPGVRLDENMLGPAHILVRRCIEAKKNLPPAAIQFEAPLRTRNGRIATGSHLLRPEILKQVLTWVTNKPHLAVVLVDRDGKTDRKKLLQDTTAKLSTPLVLGVAQEEFESWLLADGKALSQVFLGASTVGAPEDLPPGDAKIKLEELCKSSQKDLKEASLSLVGLCDLTVLSKVCSSFNDFLRAL